LANDQIDVGTKLGLGIAGPHGSRLVPEIQTRNVIQTAIENGIVFLDTAPAYGGGEAERRLGRAVQGLKRSDLFVSTKVGLNEQHQRDFSPEGIEQSLRRSLIRLNMPFVDVLFLHGPDPAELTPELFQKLESLKQQGLFRHLGVTGRANELDAALELDAFELIMLPMGPRTIEMNRKRAKRAQGRGLVVVGIEMLSHTRRVWRPSVNPGDIWHMLRSLVRGSSLPSADTAMEALKSALKIKEVNIVLSSTTKIPHVEEWRRVLDELPDAT
jgi:predicted aldo/keto reductase-like oxidoreductase